MSENLYQKIINDKSLKDCRFILQQIKIIKKKIDNKMEITKDEKLFVSRMELLTSL